MYQVSNIPNLLLPHSRIVCSHFLEQSEEAPLKPVPKPSLLRRTRNHPVRTALIVGAVVVCILALALGLVFGLRARNSGSNSVSSSGVANLDVSPPNNGFPSILEAFVSYAIEFYYLPDFAGREIERGEVIMPG